MVFTFPVCRDLSIYQSCSYHAFEYLLIDHDKWMQIQTLGTESYMVYQNIAGILITFATRILMFRGQISGMAEYYFGLLKRRNSAAYADAYAQFCGQMAAIAARYFHEDFNRLFCGSELCLYKCPH